MRQILVKKNNRSVELRIGSPPCRSSCSFNPLQRSEFGASSPVAAAIASLQLLFFFLEAEEKEKNRAIKSHAAFPHSVRPNPDGLAGSQPRDLTAGPKVKMFGPKLGFFFLARCGLVGKVSIFYPTVKFDCAKKTVLFDCAKKTVQFDCKLRFKKYFSEKSMSEEKNGYTCMFFLCAM